MPTAADNGELVSFVSVPFKMKVPVVPGGIIMKCPDGSIGCVAYMGMKLVMLDDAPALLTEALKVTFLFVLTYNGLIPAVTLNDPVQIV